MATKAISREPYYEQVHDSAPFAHPSRDTFAQFVLAGTVCIVLFGVLAFGAVEPWSQLVLRCSVALLFAAWLMSRAITHDTVRKNPAYLTLLFLALLPVTQLALGLTAYRYSTLDAILTFAPCAMVFVLASECIGDSRRCRNLLYSLAIFGGLYALFAIVQSLSGTDKLYWIHRPASLSAMIFGSYVNHNHYAGFIEMIFPSAFVLSWVERRARRLTFAFFATAMAISLILCQSRGGMIGFAAELLVLAFLLRSSRMRLKTGAVLATLAIASVAAALWLGQSSVANRITDLQDGFRLRIDADCLRMWKHRPLIGYGLGTFGTLYPQFRSFYTDLYFNHAHNDWLEFVVEAGAIGVALLIWFFAAVMKNVRPVFPEQVGIVSATRIAAVAGISGLLVHSLFDFNLHIPANGLLFFALCGVASGTAVAPSRSFRSRFSSRTLEGTR